MKINNKGFMMAEVVVVSAIVLVTLTSLYASYSKIYSLYRSRLDYNDVQTFYRVTYYRDYLILKEKLDINKLTDGYLNISGSNIGEESNEANTIEYVPDDTNDNTNIYLIYLIDGSIDFDIEGISDSYKDYLRYLNTIMKNKDDIEYILTMEKCNDKVCKYAYVEL